MPVSLGLKALFMDCRPSLLWKHFDPAFNSRMKFFHPFGAISNRKGWNVPRFNLGKSCNVGRVSNSENILQCLERRYSVPPVFDGLMDKFLQQFRDLHVKAWHDPNDALVISMIPPIIL